MLYKVIGIISFLGFIGVFYHRRLKGTGFLLPSDCFALFFALTWSPACFFPIEATHISSHKISPDVQFLFTLAYVSICAFLSLGYWLGCGLFSPRLRVTPFDRLPSVSVIRKDRAMYLLACSLACVFVLFYLSSGELRSHLRDVFNYVRSAELMSYTELRREVARGGVVFELFYPRLQYSFIFLIFVVLLVFGFLSAKRMVISLPLAVVLFCVCAATLKKMPFVFFTFSGIMITLMYLRYRGVRARFLMVWGGVGAAALFAIIFSLYQLQYRDYAQVDDQRILQVIKFRVLTAYPDGFKLYLDLFPAVFEHSMGKSIGLLQPVLGYVEQPYTLVSTYFGAMTTFPGGYASYAYADFGLFGIVLFSFLIGGYIAFLNAFVARRRFLETRMIAQVSIGLSMLWLCSKSFPTALLTGGLGLIPICIFAFEQSCLNAGASVRRVLSGNIKRGING